MDLATFVIKPHCRGVNGAAPYRERRDGVAAAQVELCPTVLLRALKWA